MNAQDKDRYTPLHVAVAKGHLEFTKLLIKAGANLNAKARFGRTPLHSAINNDYGYYGEVVAIDVAKLLIKAGANLNAEDKDGRTPLDCAAEKVY